MSSLQHEQLNLICSFLLPPLRGKSDAIAYFPPPHNDKLHGKDGRKRQMGIEERYKELAGLIEADYADYHLKAERLKKVKQDPLMNALQIKFAYAVTCHKAQGGQWKCVFVDQGYITEETIDRNYLRWLYTAITRATERVFLVNFNDAFFGQESPN